MGTLTKVAEKREVQPGKGKSVSAGNKRLAIFNVNGRFYAIDDECSHAGAPLGEGDLQGTTVTCSWHGATFDVTTGKVLSEPAASDLKAYKVVVEGEDIKVEI